jgi:Secretion system C-terminal sorting domain
MKKLITLTVLTLTCLCGFSQSIERKLVGTAGSTFISSNYQLSFSIGESVILPSPSGTLSQSGHATLFTIGFQQPQVAKTGALVKSNNWVSAYPNPAINIVRLDVHGDNFQTNEVRVSNVLGQPVYAPFVFVNGSIDIKLGNLAAGTYFITVTDKATGNAVTTKILKQNN